jgi:hypothetical protein
MNCIILDIIIQALWGTYMEIIRWVAVLLTNCGVITPTADILTTAYITNMCLWFHN